MTGEVRWKGVTESSNAVLHPWLKQELAVIVAGLPVGYGDEIAEATRIRVHWVHWQEGLSIRFSLLEDLPSLRMLLILDNLAGHKSANLVCWLMAHGIMPLYTPISGSWLNMAKSIQRILVSRALAGQHPDKLSTADRMVRSGCPGLECPPHAVYLGGKRALRRQRAQQRHYSLGG